MGVSVRWRSTSRRLLGSDGAGSITLRSQVHVCILCHTVHVHVHEIINTLLHVLRPCAYMLQQMNTCKMYVCMLLFKSNMYIPCACGYILLVRTTCSCADVIAYLTIIVQNNVILAGHSEGDDTEQLLDEVRIAHFFLNTAQKILSDYREFCKRVRELTFMYYQAINQSFIVTCQNSQPSRAFNTVINSMTFRCYCCVRCTCTWSSRSLPNLFVLHMYMYTVYLSKYYRQTKVYSYDDLHTM